MLPMNGLKRSSAEMMGHRGKRTTADIQTPQHRDISMANKDTLDGSAGSRLHQLFLGYRRAKKLPYWSDRE